MNLSCCLEAISKPVLDLFCGFLLKALSEVERKILNCLRAFARVFSASGGLA